MLYIFCCCLASVLSFFIVAIPTVPPASCRQRGQDRENSLRKRSNFIGGGFCGQEAGGTFVIPIAIGLVIGNIGALLGFGIHNCRKNAMQISVVILTRNRLPLLRQCLEALEKQSRPADEIVVVNNGSWDMSLPEIEGLRVISGPESGAYGASRNRGVEAASGDWVAFTDDDCLPAPDWLERIEKIADGPTDTVGGLVEPVDGLKWPRWWHPEMGWCIGVSVPGHWTEQAGSVYYGQTANWASRRDILLREPFQETATAFSEGQRVYEAGREDAELWRRLRIRGYRVRFDPRLAVRHQIGQERLLFRNIAQRAWLDGVSLQRREPSDERVIASIHYFLGLPGAFIREIWHGEGSSLSEAAWRLVWALREAGQCRELCRRKGWLRGLTFLSAQTAKGLILRINGYLKRSIRRGAIRVFRIFRPKKLEPRRPEKVLVAAFGFLGDMLLLRPVLESLKQLRPDMKLVLLTNRMGEQVYRNVDFLDGLIRIGDEGDPVLTKRLVRTAIDGEGPDAIFIPYYYGQSPKDLFACRQARIATFDEEVGFPRRWWYNRADVRVKKPRGKPEMQNLLALFKHAGLERLLPAGPYAIESPARKKVDADLTRDGLAPKEYIVLMPGSAKEFKLWPEDRWAALLRYIVNDRGMQAVLLGTPAEEPLCRRVVAAAGVDAPIHCQLTIPELGHWLDRAKLLIAPDNGAVHLAVTLGTPSLILFGATDERQWGPFRQQGRHRIVRRCTFDLTPEEWQGLSPRHQMECIHFDDLQKELDEMLAVVDKADG